MAIIYLGRTQLSNTMGSLKENESAIQILPNEPKKAVSEIEELNSRVSYSINTSVILFTLLISFPLKKVNEKHPYWSKH